MFDHRLKVIIERDLKELWQLDPEQHTKAVMLLSGSIIEGILCDALIAAGEWDFDKAVNKNLVDLIGPAVALGILREEYLSQAARSSRNLIHPGREVRDDIVFSSSDAAVSKHTVDIVIRDVARWSVNFKRKAALRERLKGLSECERELVGVFRTDPPGDDSGFDHERLSSEAYNSIRQLEIDKILTIGPKNPLDGGRVITLRPELPELIDQVLGESPTKRTEVKLDLSNVDAWSGEGSGVKGR